MKFKHRLLAFIIAMCFLNLVGTRFLPRGANGEVMGPDLYQPIFAIISLVFAFNFHKLPFVKKHFKSNRSSDQEDDYDDDPVKPYLQSSTRATSTNSSYNFQKSKYQSTSTITRIKGLKSPKENAKVLLQEAQGYAQSVNSSEDVIDFSFYYKKLMETFDELIFLNERQNVFMAPSPRSEKDRIHSNIGNTISDFLERCFSRALKIDDKMARSNEIEHILNMMANDSFFCSLLTDRNKMEITNYQDMIISLREKAYEEFPALQKYKERTENKLSYADKERIMVERIQQGDMEQFASLPYILTAPIYKVTGEHTHAYAYMNLNDYNIAVAKEHLSFLNTIIDAHRPEIPLLKSKYFIDVNKIAFSEYSKAYGYTKLICSPYTFSGSVSKFPLSLNFMTDFTQKPYSATGIIRYGSDGEIKSAEANIWYKPRESEPGTGWQFYFTKVNDNLELERAKSTLAQDKYGQPTDVYKHPSLILEEKQREMDYQTYLWIQKNLPSLCPKSSSAFRTMKKKNTKNYQKIVEEAAKLGKEI